MRQAKPRPALNADGPASESTVGSQSALSVVNKWCVLNTDPNKEVTVNDMQVASR